MGKDEEAGVSNGPSQSHSSSLPPAKKTDLHPAVFVAYDPTWRSGADFSIWIFFSGSVILFNKWVLDTAGFRKLSSLLVADIRIPDFLNDVAFGLCDGNDANPRSNDASPQWT